MCHKIYLCRISAHAVSLLRQNQSKLPFSVPHFELIKLCDIVTDRDKAAQMDISQIKCSGQSIQLERLEDG